MIREIVKAPRRAQCLAALVCAMIWSASLAHAADAVFSGPQPGEKITPFKALALNDERQFSEVELVKGDKTSATTLVFVHTVERSLVPLLRVIDQYAGERADKLKTEVIFLAADRLQGEQRVKAVTGSIKLKSRASLSPEGSEGPGNYGLNKECMMTVIVAQENKVTAAFALVQPGITDAPKIIEAMAKASGDAMPPTVEALTARAMPGDRGRMAPPGNPAGDRPAENFPGAVPTDPELNTVLRRLLRKENDNATVDSLIKQMEKRVEGDDALKKQAADGWKRVLHFGDRYGTEYARKSGQDFLKKMEPEPAKR